MTARTTGWRSHLFLLTAGIFGATGVMLGAFHAHGLEAWLGEQLSDAALVPSRMHHAAVAVQYQLLHAVALLALAAAPRSSAPRLHGLVAVLWTLGVLGFSGGLAAGVFLGPVLHWSVVPGGGLFLVAGWIAVAAGAFSRVPA